MKILYQDMLSIISLVKKSLNACEPETYLIDPLIILDGIVGATLETKNFVKMMINCLFFKEQYQVKKLLAQKIVYHLYRFNTESPHELSLAQVQIIKDELLDQSTSTKN